MKHQKEMLLLPACMLALVLSMNLASAIIVNSVFTDEFSPGAQGELRIELKNEMSEDATEVSLNLKFQDLPFIPIGSSEQSIDQIDSDDKENFVFIIKVAPDIKPGDYELPYTLSYKIDNNVRTNAGTIGLKVVAQPDLVFTSIQKNNIINTKGTIELKIVNRGFYDARFVSVKLYPAGYKLLSDEEVYIGKISSDDFETAAFDVYFNSYNPTLNAIVTYTDFNNQQIKKNVVIPIKVYSQENAISLGIIKKSQNTTYILIAVAVVLFIIVWRAISKRRKLKRSMREREAREK